MTDLCVSKNTLAADDVSRAAFELAGAIERGVVDRDLGEAMRAFERACATLNGAARVLITEHEAK